MLHEDSPALKALIQSFSRSQQKVNDILLKTKGNTVQEFTFNVQKAIKQNIFEMNNKVQAWAIKDLAKAYGQGEEFATQKAKENANTPTTPLSQERPLNAYIELMDATTHVGENVMQTINKTIADITKGGRDVSIYEVKEALKKELAQNGGNAGYVQYKNGMKMPYDSYAQMYARTARIETANTGVIDRCKQIGIDLVVCRSMPTCCPTCKKYSDHVFSISGTSTIYPPLYNGPNSPFQNGYNVIHPNDRCEFVPFIEDLHSEEELQKIQKESNTFTEYSKHDKLFKIYNKQQAILRQNREEEREYIELKRVLGNQMPYTTLGGFRRAKRENSVEYQRVRIFLDSQRKNIKFSFSFENLPKQFYDSSRSKRHTQKLIEFLNQRNPDNNNEALSLYSRINALNKFMNKDIPLVIKYGSDNQYARSLYKGKLNKITLNIPPLDGDDNRGAINTTLHELGHMLDSFYNGNEDGELFTKHYAPLTDVIKKGVQQPIQEIQDMFRNAKEKSALWDTRISTELKNINTRYTNGEYTTYEEYRKDYSKTKKSLLREMDYELRNQFNGLDHFQDIYDALSCGSYSKSKIVRYGHGDDFTKSSSTRNCEVFADYCVLKISRPDLVDLLKKDKPDLVEVLDNLLHKMLEKE